MSLKFILSNIGYVIKAEINLSGLTVVAGYNSTGKSTVGKALYGCLGGPKALLSRELGETDGYLKFSIGRINRIMVHLFRIFERKDINISDMNLYFEPIDIINLDQKRLSLNGKLLVAIDDLIELKNKADIYEVW